MSSSIRVGILLLSKRVYKQSNVGITMSDEQEKLLLTKFDIGGMNREIYVHNNGLPNTCNQCWKRITIVTFDCGVDRVYLAPLRIYKCTFLNVPTMYNKST